LPAARARRILRITTSALHSASWIHSPLNPPTLSSSTLPTERQTSTPATAPPKPAATLPVKDNNSSMDNTRPNDPLHGKTLEMILNELVANHGWEYMCERVRINCFYENPSISSSLKFLRKTPWARKKVEQLYIDSL
jgi:hypothetical protein